MTASNIIGLCLCKGPPIYSAWQVPQKNAQPSADVLESSFAIDSLYPNRQGMRAEVMIFVRPESVVGSLTRMGKPSSTGASMNEALI